MSTPASTCRIEAKRVCVPGVMAGKAPAPDTPACARAARGRPSEPAASVTAAAPRKPRRGRLMAFDMLFSCMRGVSPDASLGGRRKRHVSETGALCIAVYPDRDVLYGDTKRRCPTGAIQRRYKAPAAAGQR
ncbi:hypothetical protein CBM2599_A120050 [Cupriavidus taiwanensis]|nr:hypothetical protein CBM2599_A120050 [Cupriavidus taiwanensis]SOY81458.1 hypothetical protein CBM2600_A120076 [Cupriavidus taiwanensis]